MDDKPAIPEGYSMTDHDLLIKVNSTLEALSGQVSEVKALVKEQNKAFDARLRILETDSAAFKAECENINKDVDALNAKSTLWDGILGIVAIIGTIIGSILGGKN